MSYEDEFGSLKSVTIKPDPTAMEKFAEKIRADRLNVEYSSIESCIHGCKDVTFLINADNLIRCPVIECGAEFYPKRGVKKIDALDCPRKKLGYIECPECKIRSCKFEDEKKPISALDRVAEGFQVK